MVVPGEFVSGTGVLVLVVGLMAYFPDTRVALYVGPAFLVLLTVLFYVFKLQPTGVSQGAVRSAS
ncbi:putative proline-specific permease [compost metagenome]